MEPAGTGGKEGQGPCRASLVFGMVLFGPRKDSWGGWQSRYTDQTWDPVGRWQGVPEWPSWGEGALSSPVALCIAAST